MYAWIKATANSNTTKINKAAVGIKLAKNITTVPAWIIAQLKPTITFNKVWPAIIFANRRTDNLLL